MTDAAEATTAFNAQGSEPGTTLRVLVYDYNSTDADGTRTSDYRPRSGVEVKVIGTEDDAPTDREETDKDGEAVFPDLLRGKSYTLKLDPPEPQFASVRYFQVNDQGVAFSDNAAGGISFVPNPAAATTTATFAIPDPAPPEIRIQAGLVPKEARLRVNVTTDANGEPKPIDNVTISVYRGDVLIRRGQTGNEGEDDEDPIAGQAQLTLEHLGVVTVRAPSTIRLAPSVGQSSGASVLRSTLRGPLLVQVEPAGDHVVNLSYVGERASLSVRATYELMLLGATRVFPFPGVKFRLSRDGATAGARTNEATTDGRGWVTFYDLDDGPYTVEVVSPPEYKGTAVELAKPQGGLVPVSVIGGTTIDLPDTFRFRALTGSVSGFVLAAGSDEGVGGAPVALIPSNGTGTAEEVTTEADGSFTIDDVALGTYTLGLERHRFTSADGRRWERHRDAPDQTITLAPASPSATGTLRVTREEHVVDVHITLPDGRPLAHAMIDVWDDDTNTDTAIASFALDANGSYRWLAPHAGRFSFAVRSDHGQPIRRVPALVNSVTPLSFVFEGAGGASFGTPLPTPPPPTNGSQGGVAGALSDLAAYPVLTGDVGGFATPGGGGGGAPSSTVLGRVQNAIRDVLGWRPREGDTKGYLAALGQAFTSEEMEGRTIWTYTPRSYAIQADLGRITGAQASIYARARAALDQSLPLLDGLKALDPAADEENLEAIRSVVHSDLTELVNEFGEQGGPRVARVDGLFDGLAGALPAGGAAVSPEQVGGELGELARRFGLLRRRVNTVDEEENFTNFLIIADHVQALRQSWIANRPYFLGTAGGPEPFFGTQLVLLSRALAVVAESVQEVFFAMDSVFMRAGERQTTLLNIANEPPMFVEGLLQWALEFASEEGPRLIHEGGKIGANSAVPTLRRLTRLVEAAAQLARTDPSLPAGYRTARVQRAIQELADYLEAATRLAERIGQPDGVGTSADGQPSISDEQLRRVVFQVLQSLPQTVPAVAPAPAAPVRPPGANGATGGGDSQTGTTGGSGAGAGVATVNIGRQPFVFPEGLFPPGFLPPGFDPHGGGVLRANGPIQ